MLTALAAALAPLESDHLVFPRLGIDLTVKSTAFTVFGVSVAWYGILIMLGMLLAMIYGFSRMREFGIDSDRAIDAIIGGVIGGIIGARAYYVIFHWESFAGDWKSVFNIRQGGLAIYGGIIGAVLVGGIICKIRKVRLLPMLDIAGLGFLIGQSIGRWGNFMNHEAFGTNTDNLFGMSSGRIQAYIAQNFPDGSVDPYQPVHPCFLYESVWCLLGFVILHIISKKWRKFDGEIALLYVVWYGAGRFMIEGLRTDSLRVGTVRVSQVLALVSAIAAAVLFVVMYFRTKRQGTDYKLYRDTAESAALLEETERKYEEREARRKAKKQAKARESGRTHTIMSEEDEELEDEEQREE